MHAITEETWFKAFRLGQKHNLHTEAIRVLNRNQRGPLIVELDRQARREPAWEELFIAFGVAEIRPDTAAQMLRAGLAEQGDDGSLPYTVGDPPNGRAPRLVTAPFHALLVERLAERLDPHAARSMLEWAYPRLERWHRFLAKYRKAPGSDLAYIIHPRESTIESSPAWDRPMATVANRNDLPDLDQSELYDAGFIDPSLAVDDAQLSRRLAGYTLAHGSRFRDPVRESPFLVVDPLFNAVYLAAVLALRRIAAQLGAPVSAHAETAARLREALHELWDPDAEWYRAIDLLTGERLGPRTIAGAVPLLDPKLPSEHRDAILARLRTDAFVGPGPDGWGIMTCESHATAFVPMIPGRGAISPIMNTLIGLAARRHGAEELSLRCDYSTLAAAIRRAAVSGDGSSRFEVSFGDAADAVARNALHAIPCSSTPALIIEQLHRRVLGARGG